MANQKCWQVQQTSHHHTSMIETKACDSSWSSVCVEDSASLLRFLWSVHDKKKHGLWILSPRPPNLILKLKEWRASLIFHMIGSLKLVKLLQSPPFYVIYVFFLTYALFFYEWQMMRSFKTVWSSVLVVNKSKCILHYNAVTLTIDTKQRAFNLKNTRASPNNKTFHDNKWSHSFIWHSRLCRKLTPASPASMLKI